MLQSTPNMAIRFSQSSNSGRARYFRSRSARSPLTKLVSISNWERESMSSNLWKLRWHSSCCWYCFYHETPPAIMKYTRRRQSFIILGMRWNGILWIPTKWDSRRQVVHQFGLPAFGDDFEETLGHFALPGSARSNRITLDAPLPTQNSRKRI